MKRISTYLLILVLMLSCSQDDLTSNSQTQKGGYIIFENSQLTTGKNNLLEIDENSVVFKENIVDPNNNATAYSLTLVYDEDGNPFTEETKVTDFLVINSFPNTVEIVLKDILDALGLTLADINKNTLFAFEASVTSPLGTFTREVPDLNYFNGVPVFNANSTDNDLTPSSGENGVLHAMNFSIQFFVPPPNKYRGTSFEEPFAALDPGDDYIRPDSQGVDDEGELFNNPFQRNVSYQAKGNGIDDEIGFRSFFFSNGQGGFRNEEIGVTRKTEDVQEYLDGIQGFQLEDVDGRFRLQFDKVEIPSDLVNTGVQISVFFRDTTWEVTETLYAFVEIEYYDGSQETKVIADYVGGQIDALKGAWFQIDTGFLKNVKSYQLIIDTEINSPNEEVYFDRMLVYQP